MVERGSGVIGGIIRLGSHVSSVSLGNKETDFEKLPKVNVNLINLVLISGLRFEGSRYLSRVEFTLRRVSNQEY